MFLILLSDFKDTIRMLKGNQRSIVAAAIAGIFVSTYALYVEMAAEIRPGYKALCDISEHASCSRVLTSKWVYNWTNIAVFRVNLRDNIRPEPYKTVRYVTVIRFNSCSCLTKLIDLLTFCRYSKGFGLIPEDSPLVVPNCVYGVIFYCLMIFLCKYCFT